MYALFAGFDADYDCYNKGGFNDLKAVAKDWEPLLAKISNGGGEGCWFFNPKDGNEAETISWWHVVDLTNLMIVRSNLFAEDWQWFENNKFGVVDAFYKNRSRAEKPKQRTTV